MRQQSRMASHRKCIGIFSRKTVARFICPLHEIIVLIRNRLYRYRCIMVIDTFDRIYRAVLGGRHTHVITVYGKMRHKSRIAFHRKAVRISRKAVNRRICPLHKMIPRIRNRPYRCHRIIVMRTSARYRAVRGGGGYTHVITVCGKMRHENRIVFHNTFTGIGIGQRKSVPGHIRPLHKSVTFIRISCRLRRHGAAVRQVAGGGALGFYGSSCRSRNNIQIGKGYGSSCRIVFMHKKNILIGNDGEIQPCKL
ncbi:hypothetical protein Barb4_05472 [Bacteroidales bacterium Barb4]|nr:hypothetical protein Barb4_05472 [Bacteroidales bacterium Barb4]